MGTFRGYFLLWDILATTLAAGSELYFTAAWMTQKDGQKYLGLISKMLLFIPDKRNSLPLPLHM